MCGRVGVCVWEGGVGVWEGGGRCVGGWGEWMCG